jgi:hypothetical protein
MSSRYGSGPALSRHDKIGDVEDTTSKKMYSSAVQGCQLPILRIIKTTIGDAVHLAYLHTFSDSLQSGRLMQG